MIALGIESTAHTFGVGIITFEGKILANIKEQFTTTSGGMIPNEVANHHKQVADSVIERALKVAKCSWEDITVIAVSNAPGLPPCLHVGLNLAKQLAQKYEKPLVEVNHSIAHLTIGDLICKVKDPVYLYVSGPNTQVLARAGDYFRVFGETLDVGLGNMLDKFARDIGLGFPGGPKIEQQAKGQYVELPYVVKGMDVSFAGLLTKALRLHKNGMPTNDLCFSLQETAFAMLAEVAERALAHTGKTELLLIGGVAANKRLKEMLELMCEARGVKFFVVPIEYSGDQGVMIAWQGILQFNAGRTVEPKTADIRPYERIDDVKIFW